MMTSLVLPSADKSEMKKEQTSFLDLQRCQGVGMGLEQYSIKDIFEIDFLTIESSFHQSTNFGDDTKFANVLKKKFCKKQ